MERWPAWSAPLLGACGGGIAGLALTGNPRIPFSPLDATLDGVALGLLAGVVVAIRDKRRPAVDIPAPVATRPAISTPPSRWKGFLLMLAGAGCLAAHHALVLATGKKWFTLVCGGSLFLALGLAGFVLPQILTAGATGERVPWWGHLIGGLLAVTGLAVGLYLWLVVY